MSGGYVPSEAEIEAVLREHESCDYVITDDHDTAYECGILVTQPIPSLAEMQQRHMAAALVAAHAPAPAPREDVAEEGLIAERDEALAEVERLRTRRGDCVCDYNPNTTDGPSENCPQHGRPYSYWVDGVEALAAQLAEARAALADTVPAAAVRELVEHGVGTDLNPTRLAGDPEHDLWWLDYLSRHDATWRDRLRWLLIEGRP